MTSSPDNEVAAELRAALAPRIQLLRPLGEGGMGFVWLGRDPALKRHVAIKVLHPELAFDAGARARFAREAEAAAAVSHPGVVSVYQVGELPGSGTSYFVMQYVEGRSLEQELTPGQAVSEARLRRVIGEIASALAAAHQRGLVHRDIKPANIMIEQSSGRVVVLDFGISAALERRDTPQATRLTAEGHSLGTPLYMSPEQAAAQDVTPRSDVYSLGVVAFEMATGQPPFMGETAMEIAAAHLKDTPPSVARLRPDLDPQLAALIDRCLAKAPRDRPDATDIARALAPGAHTVIEWPPPGLEPLRGSGADLTSLMGAAAGIGLLFFLVLRTQPILLGPLWYVERYLAFDGTPVWYTALNACLLALLVITPLAARRAWRVATLVRAGRASGYPGAVLADVALDQQPDTSLLLNGLGPYALVEPAQRDRLMALRRRRAACILSAILLAMVTPLLWLVGLLGGWSSHTGPVVPGPEVLLLFGPALVALLGAAHSARPEAALRARLAPERSREEAAAPVRRELVSGWLAAAGRTPGQPAWHLPRAVLLAFPLLLIAGVAGAMVVVLNVAFTVGTALQQRREAARELVQSLRTDSLRPSDWRAIDAALVRLAGEDAALPTLGTGDSVTRHYAMMSRAARMQADRNDSMAAWFVRHSDTTAALRALRANIGIGRALMATGSGHLDGRRLFNQAVRQLDELAAARHDAALLAETRRVAAAVEAAFPDDRRWHLGLPALMADPSGAGLSWVMRDSTLAPAIRVRALVAALNGFCLNTREVLFGPDRRRQALLDSAAAMLSDVPGAPSLIEIARQDLAAVARDPKQAAVRGAFRSRYLTPLVRWGPRGLRGRLEYCGNTV